MGGVAFAIFFVVAMGVVLYVNTDYVDQVRAQGLLSVPTDNYIEHFFLYMLLPILWFGWLIVSLFLVVATARSSSG